MTRDLKSGRRGPEKATRAVVFLHGYGADGADLLGLADPLAPHLPGTAFYAPDAPDPSRSNPAGRQWFPIPWMDGASEADARSALLASSTDLDAFLDQVLAAEGLAPDRLAVVGFSQGTMMALHVLPRRPAAVAGIVGISGRLLGAELLSEVQVRPPVLLIHGDQDPVVPYAEMALAQNALAAAGFAVATHTMRGTGHGIAPDGLGVALAFLQEVLAD